MPIINIYDVLSGEGDQPMFDPPFERVNKVFLDLYTALGDRGHKEIQICKALVERLIANERQQEGRVEYFGVTAISNLDRLKRQIGNKKKINGFMDYELLGAYGLSIIESFEALSYEGKARAQHECAEAAGLSGAMYKAYMGPKKGADVTNSKFEPAKKFARDEACKWWKENPTEKPMVIAEKLQKRIANELNESVTVRKVKDWIKDLASPEARKPGRPRKQ